MKNGEMHEAKAGKSTPHSYGWRRLWGLMKDWVRETGIPGQQNKEEKSLNNFRFEPEGLAS